MFDRNPQRPLIAVAREQPPETFETRVLRELAAISERLSRLEVQSIKPSPPVVAPLCTYQQDIPQMPMRGPIYDQQRELTTAGHMLPNPFATALTPQQQLGRELGLVEVNEIGEVIG